MKIDEFTLPSVNTYGGGEIPPSIGLTPDVLPEVQGDSIAENSQTGVSTKNALSETPPKHIPNKKKVHLTGMHSVLRMVGRRKHTTTWWQRVSQLFIRPKPLYGSSMVNEGLSQFLVCPTCSSPMEQKNNSKPMFTTM